MKTNLDCFVESWLKQQKQPIVTQLINYLFTETNERQERTNNALLLTVSRVNHYHYHPFVGLISFIYLVGFVCDLGGQINNWPNELDSPCSILTDSVR